MRLSELIEKEITRLLNEGFFKPGDRLPSERTLMEQFQVGRPSIREALASLQQKGHLQIRRGERPLVIEQDTSVMFRGFDRMVTNLLRTPKGLHNFNEARILLERSLAREAADNATDEDIAYLTEVIDRSEKNIHSRERFSELDIAFHCYLSQMSGNALLVSVHRTAMGWLVARRGIQEENIISHNRESLDGHIKVLDAIRTGDAEQTDLAMRNHLERAEVQWISFDNINNDEFY
ncbi:FCD domain-containing protein [Polycladidibacter stylochi]|uniref:FCD domain-containing protein n=1 Tax=Polycladidibacter stylochi TaxID=1807766 RepID=UPI000835FA63|nr:FCD domain-containing protein [Pseudovibrio stylochi]